MVDVICNHEQFIHARVQDTGGSLSWITAGQSKERGKESALGSTQ